MSGIILRVSVLFCCVFVFVFTACYQPESPPAAVDAFDQTKEVQKHLSSEAQQAMDTLTNAQQVPQAVETLNNQQAGNTMQVPRLGGN